MKPKIPELLNNSKTSKLQICHVGKLERYAFKTARNFILY